MSLKQNLIAADIAEGIAAKERREARKHRTGRFDLSDPGDFKEAMDDYRATDNKANIERAMTAFATIPDHADRVNAMVAIVRAAVGFCERRTSMSESLAELDCMSADKLAELAYSVDHTYWW